MAAMTLTDGGALLVAAPAFVLDGVDALHIDFNPTALTVATVAFALMLFGVALDTPLSAFRAVARRPVVVLLGMVAQLVVLPALALGLTLALRLPGSVALGVILVACSPAGNVSNVLAHRAGGDAALSVSMTAVGNVASIVTLPLNFMLWGGLHPTGSQILDHLAETVGVSVGSMLSEVALVILAPFALGIAVARAWPGVAERLKKVLGPVGMIALFGIVVGAIVANWEASAEHLGLVLGANVAAHLTFLAFGLGVSRLVRLRAPAAKAMTFEISARNSVLATVLVFTFFDGLGGMALYTAWSGAWSILAGLVVALVWKRITARRAGSGSGSGSDDGAAGGGDTAAAAQAAVVGAGATDRAGVA